MSSRETFLTSPLAIVSPRSGPETTRIVVAEDGSPRPTKSTRRLQLIMEERDAIRLKKKEIKPEIARRHERRRKALGADGARRRGGAWVAGRERGIGAGNWNQVKRELESE